MNGGRLLRATAEFQFQRDDIGAVDRYAQLSLNLMRVVMARITRIAKRPDVLNAIKSLRVRRRYPSAMVPPMILSRIKSILPGSQPEPGRRRFRDTPVRNGAERPESGCLADSPGRIFRRRNSARESRADDLVGFPRTRGASAGPVSGRYFQTRADRGSRRTERAAHRTGSRRRRRRRCRPKAGTGTPGESEPEHATEAPKPLIANICAEARERLDLRTDTVLSAAQPPSLRLHRRSAGERRRHRVARRPLPIRRDRLRRHSLRRMRPKNSGG